MITTTHTPAARQPVLTLDDLLALTSIDMDDKLAAAGLAVDVNSASIPIDPLPEITVPQPPAAAPTPYWTPLAALLHRAAIRIQTDGRCRDALFDESGAVCPIRAIRLEASNRHQADDACFLLLEAIKRHWQADTIPSWNAQQTSVAPVLLAFERAAELAHSRNQ
ncbi:hypothetical protein ABZT16_11540 [Streptomyces flaveolus]|uniref:DUF6197 family protein n=1 Tax=Streptomyces flaveolus TaxID=67297 RepID=UPI0033AC51ED